MRKNKSCDRVVPNSKTFSRMKIPRTITPFIFFRDNYFLMYR